MYGDIVQKLSRLVAAELSRIETFYNFGLGDEFEVAMCHVLRAVFEVDPVVRTTGWGLEVRDC